MSRCGSLWGDGYSFWVNCGPGGGVSIDGGSELKSAGGAYQRKEAYFIGKWCLWDVESERPRSVLDRSDFEVQGQPWAMARAPFLVRCLLGVGNVLPFLLDGKLEQQENLLQN